MATDKELIWAVADIDAIWGIRVYGPSERANDLLLHAPLRAWHGFRAERRGWVAAHQIVLLVPSAGTTVVWGINLEPEFKDKARVETVARDLIRIFPRRYAGVYNCRPGAFLRQYTGGDRDRKAYLVWKVDEEGMLRDAQDSEVLAARKRKA
jgi:hypothetical protein